MEEKQQEEEAFPLEQLSPELKLIVFSHLLAHPLSALLAG